MNQNSIHDQISTYLIEKYSDADLVLTPSELFFNPSKKSLRLTSLGASYLKREFEHERFDIKSDKITITMRHILALERKMLWPYFISKNRSSITLFSDEDIVMFKMLGDVNTWIDSL